MLHELDSDQEEEKKSAIDPQPKKSEVKQSDSTYTVAKQVKRTKEFSFKKQSSSSSLSDSEDIVRVREVKIEKRTITMQRVVNQPLQDKIEPRS
jgi:CRISPR/Cas system-associated protein Cas5 (RAMP superfamily)